MKKITFIFVLITCSLWLSSFTSPDPEPSKLILGKWQFVSAERNGHELDLTDCIRKDKQHFKRNKVDNYMHETDEKEKCVKVVETYDWKIEGEIIYFNSDWFSENLKILILDKKTLQYTLIANDMGEIPVNRQITYTYKRK